MSKANAISHRSMELQYIIINTFNIDNSVDEHRLRGLHLFHQLYWSIMDDFVKINKIQTKWRIEFAYKQNSPGGETKKGQNVKGK